VNTGFVLEGSKLTENVIAHLGISQPGSIQSVSTASPAPPARLEHHSYQYSILWFDAWAMKDVFGMNIYNLRCKQSKVIKNQSCGL
jgi:hypothetical protein